MRTLAWTTGGIAVLAVMSVPFVFAQDVDPAPWDTFDNLDCETGSSNPDCAAFLASILALGGPGAATGAAENSNGPSCSGTHGTCSFTCGHSDIQVGATGPNGASVGGSCGGIAAGCTIKNGSDCGASKGDSASGTGTCSGSSTTTYSCGAVKS